MPSTQHERRQHERRPASFSIELKLEGDASVRRVDLRDISEGGMSFVADQLHDYRDARQVEVRVPEYAADGQVSYQVLQAEIVWLQEQDMLNPQAWVGLRLLTTA